MRATARYALSFALATLLSGCALTPDYERPELDVPATWEQPADAGASIANMPWFELYGDPELSRLIKIALEENKDLAGSLARIEEARQLLIITRADQFPFLDIFSTAGRGRQSQIVVPGAQTADNFGISAAMTFEVDLWRRYSRATEAARADLLSTEAAYRNVTITLVADVATFYLVLRDLDDRLAIARRTVDSRAASLNIIQARFDRGTVPELDVNQAQVELEIAKATAASFEREVAQTENALQVLLGRSPGPIARGLSLAEQRLPPDVPPGLASDLLQRRPDVVAAEEVLKSETALIGVAEALRYPSITLTGAGGVLSDELSTFDDTKAKSWNIAADIFAPIFNSGSLKAQADAQRARAEQALASYEGAWLEALREVEDALVAVRTFREEHEARFRQVQAARNAARLSRARYDGGVVDYLEVLDSERSLFGSELDESATRQAALNAVVQLYKALGGGWNPPAPGP